MKTYKVTIDGRNTIRWYNDKDELHREDGPAVEISNHSKAWYSKGEVHREDGPAVEYTDGTKLWYLNGKLHREDGPAVEYTNVCYWYLCGRKLTEEEFDKETSKPDCAGETVTIEGRDYILTPI